MTYISYEKKMSDNMDTFQVNLIFLLFSFLFFCVQREYSNLYWE